MTPQVEYSVDIARKLNKVLQLNNVAFAGLEAQLNRFGGPPFKFALKLNTVRWTTSENELLGAFPVTVNIQDGDSDDLASLSVLIRTTHAICDELTIEGREAVPHYLGIVGWMQVWPYVRAEIQSLSTKLGFPPLTLPVILTGQTRHVPVEHLDEVASEGEPGVDEGISLISD